MTDEARLVKLLRPLKLAFEVVFQCVSVILNLLEFLRLLPNLLILFFNDRSEACVLLLKLFDLLGVLFELFLSLGEQLLGVLVPLV